MEKNKNGNYLLTILLAVIFGLVAGISGGLMTRSSLLNDIYSIPFYGKINLSTSDSGNSLITRNSKSVVIEQDDQIKEVIVSASRSLVGIFKKISEKETDMTTLGGFVPEDNYRLADNVADGLVITSDGWVLASDFGKDLTVENISANYVAITEDGKIYTIDDFSREKDSNISFIHLRDARDLPVRNFINREDLSGGQTVIAIDWQGHNFLTHIINQETKSLKIKKSDLAKESLALANNLPEILANSFIFDLKGDLVAFFINGRDMKLVSDLNTLIKGLLNKEKKFRPSLGVNYVELSEFALKQNFSVKKGALIYPDSEGVAIIKDSVAEKSGLKEGDIIISLDNIEISRDNDLAHLLLKYVAGDEITLLYRRGVSEERIKIVLDRLK